MNYISKSATLGQDVKVGHFTVIEENVEIGANCIIGNNIVIHKGSKTGENVRFKQMCI